MNKAKVGCFWFFLILIIGASVGFVFAIQNPDKLGATPESKLAKIINTTPEQATTVIETLKLVGVEDFDNISRDDSLDNSSGVKGYNIISNGVSNIKLQMANDGSVSLVKLGEHDLYANGNHISKLNDYLLTVEEKSELQYKCQEMIKGLLKAPATAKFPKGSDWKFGKQDGVIMVQGYVDAQNGFGANIRSKFQFIIKDDKITSLIFDGQEYIK